MDIRQINTAYNGIKNIQLEINGQFQGSGLILQYITMYKVNFHLFCVVLDRQ